MATLDEAGPDVLAGGEGTPPGHCHENVEGECGTGSRQSGNPRATTSRGLERAREGPSPGRPQDTLDSDPCLRNEGNRLLWHFVITARGG